MKNYIQKRLVQLEYFRYNCYTENILFKREEKHYEKSIAAVERPALHNHI
jgi:hypothetical protein